MKMFLTRMGQNARIVVTGDTTQVDLPPGTASGLADAVERLRDGAGRRDRDAGPRRHRAAPAGAGDRRCVREHRSGRRRPRPSETEPGARRGRGPRTDLGAGRR